MKNLTYVLLLALFCFGAQDISAQKLGYLNSAELLSVHPGIKAADSQLEGLQKQYSKRLQGKVESLKARYADLEGKSETVAPKVLQEQAKKLQEEEVALQGEEQQLQAELMKKREELYQPILDVVNTAINDVAKENGYLFIFDQSQGALLFAEESHNIISLIKTKLGI